MADADLRAIHPWRSSFDHQPSPPFHEFCLYRIDLAQSLVAIRALRLQRNNAHESPGRTAARREPYLADNEARRWQRASCSSSLSQDLCTAVFGCVLLSLVGRAEVYDLQVLYVAINGVDTGGPHPNPAYGVILTAYHNIAVRARAPS